MKFEPDELEAINRFENGEQFHLSRGICESLTVGYGVLNAYGYWQLPLPREYWPDNLKELNDPFSS